MRQMEHEEQENAQRKIVNIFSRTVKTVKVIPYLFLVIYCIYLGLYCIDNKTLISILDFLYGMSAGSCMFMLFLSKELGFCIWHKIACVLPLSSVIVAAIDAFIFYLSFEEMVFINISTLVIAVCYLIWSFFHFFIDGQ